MGPVRDPARLSLDIAPLCVEQAEAAKGEFTFLDPAIGTGSFFGAFLRVFPHDRIECATGIELDEPFADAASAIWHEQGLKIDTGRLHQTDGRAGLQCHPGQPAVRSTPPPAGRGETAPGPVGARGNWLEAERTLRPVLLLPADRPWWLADSGLAVWLIPSEFMDVNYGEAIGGT